MSAESPATSPPGAVSDPGLVRAEDVVLRGHGGDSIGAYLAVPTDGIGPFPGLIVIHEAFGLNDHIRDVTRRFANLGYAALAPDLYAREGGPSGTDIDELMAKMFAVPDARAVGDLEAAAAFLRAREGASGSVGVIGFCSGARQALLFACSSDAATAAVYCWGGFVRAATIDDASTPERPVPVVDLVGRLQCPLYLAVGAEDDNPSPADVALVAERARAAGCGVTHREYAGAGHAFFADYRPSYEPRAAAMLWTDVQEFLAQHLR